jgi:hypothetical protein
MREKMEFESGRDEGAGDMKEQEDLRALDEATHEPGEAVEQRGDYREAEAIQGAFESVVETGGEIPGATPLPIPRPEDAVEPGKPPEDAAEARLDGKGGRPVSALSLDGKGNDLSAGDVPLAAPQEAMLEKDTSSPAPTLEGKGITRSTENTGEDLPSANRKAERNTDPGDTPEEQVLPAKEARLDTSDREGNFQIQELMNRATEANSLEMSIKKGIDKSSETIQSKI